MRWRVFCGALALALLGVVPASGALTFDCWKLENGKLAEARKRGLCDDAFAGPPAARSERKRAVESAERRGPPHPARSGVRAGQGGSSGSFDFGERFRQDSQALGAKLQELLSGSSGRSSSSWKGKAKPVEHDYPIP
jgi:hypothetical protein